MYIFRCGYQQQNQQYAGEQWLYGRWAIKQNTWQRQCTHNWQYYYHTTSLCWSAVIMHNIQLFTTMPITDNCYISITSIVISTHTLKYVLSIWCVHNNLYPDKEYEQWYYVATAMSYKLRKMTMEHLMHGWFIWSLQTLEPV